MGGHVDEVGNRLSSKIGTLSFMPFDPITYVELSKDCRFELQAKL